jgi:glycogen operon protein
MNDSAWTQDSVKTLGVFLPGHVIEETDERGEQIIGDSLMLLLNAHHEGVSFTLAPLEPHQQWQRVFDTDDPAAAEQAYGAGTYYPLTGRSVAVFKVMPPVLERRRAAVTRAAASPLPSPEPAAAAAAR